MLKKDEESGFPCLEMEQNIVGVFQHVSDHPGMRSLMELDETSVGYCCVCCFRCVSLNSHTSLEGGLIQT